jgi:hypothetical protein
VSRELGGGEGIAAVTIGAASSGSTVKHDIAAVSHGRTPHVAVSFVPSAA